MRLLHGVGGDSARIALGVPGAPISPPTLSEHPELLHRLPIAELRNYLNDVITACLAREDIGTHLSFIVREGKVIQDLTGKIEEAIQAELREIPKIVAGIRALRSWISEEIARVRDGEESDFDPVEAKAAHQKLLGE